MTLTFLRRVQQVDAAACLAAGLPCAAASAPLAGLTGLPQALLAGAGVFLIGFSAVVWWSARRPAPAVIGALAVVNLAWAAGGAALLLGGAFPLTGPGQVLVAVQGAAAAVVAGLQWNSLRRLGSAEAVI